MRTIGLKPGDRVLLVERRGDQELVHNGLVALVSMDENLAGANGEMSIGAVFVLAENSLEHAFEMRDVVHLSHRDWIEGRTRLAYEELPPQSGICRFCGCTELRACAGGCSWLLADRTVCNSRACVEKLRDELVEEGITIWADGGEVHDQGQKLKHIRG